MSRNYVQYREQRNIERDGADFDPTTINLSNTAGSSDSPVIAVSGNTVHIVWYDNTPGNFDILYRRSIDSGGSFGPIINLSNNAGASQSPQIAISGNNFHVVWQDDTAGNIDILYRKSADGGASFTGPIKNLSGNAGVSIAPAMAASGNNVHVVWEDNTPGNSDILYRRSIDGGSTFPNIINWEEDNEILYKRSITSGATFGATINLSDNAGSV